MSIRFSCPCGRKFKTRNGTGGRLARCSSCHSLLRIPDDGASSFETVAEVWLYEDNEARPAAASQSASALRKTLLIGGVLIFVVLAALKLASLRESQPDAVDDQNSAAKAAADTAEVRKFAAQCLDKKVPYTLSEIVNRATERGYSTDAVYNLLFGASAAGLLQVEQGAPDKQTRYRLK
jgi:hypothetical protein